ncbi:hypothetical protein RYX36_017459 [Vicia faba]
MRLNQRTLSDPHQQQDVPYWLNDLLDDDDEPEQEEKLANCVSRSHRRSSSDSIAFLNNKNILLQDPDRNINVPNPQQQQQQHPRIDPSKRLRRHSAQQYRARKVQYIGELETSVQSLQAEGYQVSAELEFLDQQNLILGMENRALKQRLDSLSQEHFIKCLEQEVLEKEISRLRNIYQQQQHRQQQQQKHNGRNRPKRQDIDSSIAKLSLKIKGIESSQKTI